MDHKIRRLRTSWPHGNTLSLLKNTKISWVWHIPVVPATVETEAGELLESGRQRLH